MVLAKETKIGMTVGQLLAVISLLITLLGGYVSLKVEIATIDTIQQGEIKRVDKVEQASKEINNKLDNLIYYITGVNNEKDK